MTSEYNDIKYDVRGRIGVIKVFKIYFLPEAMSI